MYFDKSLGPLDHATGNLSEPKNATPCRWERFPEMQAGGLEPKEGKVRNECWFSHWVCKKTLVGGFKNIQISLFPHKNWDENKKNSTQHLETIHKCVKKS